MTASPADESTPGPQDAPRSSRAAPLLDGPRLRTAATDASAVLRRHVSALNAINVFPVPDGDTGTNMHLTFRAGVDALSQLQEAGLADVAQTLAQGTLMGARGNSGVILSQVLRGFAAALQGRDQADGPALAAALAAGAAAAQEALSQPKEGTILTVARDAAQAVAAAPPAADEALARAVNAAKASVARTPELLPVLKEAGVVDAGGLGLAIILEGILRSLRGEPLDVDLAPDVGVQAAWRGEAASFHEAHHGETGYCTEFVVSGERLDAGAAREGLSALGTSLLVVGGDGLLRVHVHTTAPDDALAYGRTLGEVSRVKVDNMEAQIQRFVAEEMPQAPVATSIGVVAVAAGEGVEAAFRSVGVTHLVQGGQTMNPSAAEILETIEAGDEDEVVVLPNNKNIIAAAEQAAERSRKRVAVVPSRSIPQGVAAVLALNSDLPFEANVAAMERALTSVRSAEVTRSVRAVTIEGRRIEEGQAIGIVDGSLRVVAADVASAVRDCIAQMRSQDATLLTLYAGADVRESDAAQLADELRRELPEIEVELVRGGQPHYPYILSLE